MGEVMEAIVANAEELRDGEMREVKVGETPVLLAKVAGEIHALGAMCTHYGAPLAKGALHGDRIICPWHHACFRVADGSLLQPPALDALPRYNVRIDNGSVIVTLAVDAPDRREPAMTAAGDDERTFVIVGAGAAGQAAAERLRQLGFAGKILMLSDHAPIDRPSLSKEYIDGEVGADLLPLRPDDFYSQHNINLKTGAHVSRIDITQCAVYLADGTGVTADAILLALGSTPIQTDVEGNQLPQVFTLRQQSDAGRILAQAEGAKRAIVVGASFIGMEVAASLRKRGLQVTVVAPEQVPYAKVLGPEIGTMFLNLHAEQGVEFRLGHKLGRIEGNEQVEAVVLDDGERLPADFVVIGIGVRPASKQIEGLPLEQDGGVTVDAGLKLAGNVWAAGDIARFPEHISNQSQRIEHWRLAEQHGRHAAAAMLGDTAPFTDVPFFWTKQFDTSLRYVGHATRWDEIIYWGDPAARDFIAFYVEGGRVAAATGVKRDQAMAAIEALMQDRSLPSVDELRKGEIDLVGRMRGEG